jgi:hypothetical protein
MPERWFEIAIFDSYSSQVGAASNMKALTLSIRKGYEMKESQ